MPSLAGCITGICPAGAIAISTAMVIAAVAVTVMNMASRLRTSLYLTNRIIAPAVMAVMGVLPHGTASLFCADRITSPISMAVMGVIPRLAAPFQGTYCAGSL